jgi:hypothetical protein
MWERGADPEILAISVQQIPHSARLGGHSAPNILKDIVTTGEGMSKYQVSPPPPYLLRIGYAPSYTYGAILDKVGIL